MPLRDRWLFGEQLFWTRLQFADQAGWAHQRPSRWGFFDRTLDRTADWAMLVGATSSLLSQHRDWWHTPPHNITPTILSTIEIRAPPSGGRI